MSYGKIYPTYPGVEVPRKGRGGISFPPLGGKLTRPNLPSKSTPRRGTAKSTLSEETLQTHVVTFFARMLPPGAVCWATPNGGSRHHLEAIRLKATGTLAGIPDLFVLHEGKLIGIELKRPAPVLASGRASRSAPNVSDAQAHTMTRLNAAGAQCFVCRSIGEVEAALKLCGVPLGRSNPFRPVNVSREMP